MTFAPVGLKLTVARSHRAFLIVETCMASVTCCRDNSSNQTAQESGFIMTVRHQPVIEREGVLCAHVLVRMDGPWGPQWTSCCGAEQFVLFHEVTHKNLSSAREFIANVKWLPSFCIGCCFSREKHLTSFVSLKHGNHLPRGDSFSGNQTRAHPKARIYRLSTHTHFSSCLICFSWVQ